MAMTPAGPPQSPCRLPGRPLLPGTASGTVLKLRAPLSLWGGVDASNGVITLGGHPEHGECMRGRVVVVSELVGSSSSSAVMLELLCSGAAPSGLVLRRPDAILCLGVIVASEMGWPTIPVVQCDPAGLRTGQAVRILPDGTIEIRR